MSVYLNDTAWRCIPEDGHLHTRRRENLKYAGGLYPTDHEPRSVIFVFKGHWLGRVLFWSRGCSLGSQNVRGYWLPSTLHAVSHPFHLGTLCVAVAGDRHSISKHWTELLGSFTETMGSLLLFLSECCLLTTVQHKWKTSCLLRGRGGGGSTPKYPLWRRLK
jgi:hypothetical protein